MSGFDIQKKVKSGLSKAIKATGPAQSLVYKVEISDIGTPINPVPPIETQTLLVDAIFKSYAEGLVDGSIIQVGDKELVTNGDVEINPNDTIRAGDDDYLVINVDKKNPAGVPLAYISQVRLYDAA